jgi:hypothetical protein
MNHKDTDFLSFSIQYLAHTGNYGDQTDDRVEDSQIDHGIVTEKFTLFDPVSGFYQQDHRTDESQENNDQDPAVDIIRLISVYILPGPARYTCNRLKNGSAMKRNGVILIGMFIKDMIGMEMIGVGENGIFDLIQMIHQFVVFIPHNFDGWF